MGGTGDGVVVFGEDGREIPSELGMRVSTAAKGVRSFAVGGAAVAQPSVLFACHDGRWGDAHAAEARAFGGGLGVVEGVSVGVYDVVCAAERMGGTARR